MPSLSRTAVASLTLLSLLDVSQAAGVPRAKNPSTGHAVTMKGTSGGSPMIAPTKVEDFLDALYLVDIVIGGEEFTVQMDTGSADLWVIPSVAQDVELVNTTDIVISETYGSGNATGTIQFAELEFAGFTVPSQAFLLADTAVDFAPDFQGIMGLSFESFLFSPINLGIKVAFLDINTTVGATPIFNVLSQNDTIPNSFDIQLERTEDLNQTTLGTLIVGHHLPGYENITNQPRLPRVFDGRWTIPMDSMSVNGGLFEFNQSSVPGVFDGQIAVVLDSGFTFPPLPPLAVDFIYSSIPGAIRGPSPDGGQWIVPCNGTTNLTFTFGGLDFPVHYLDLAAVDTTILTIHGKATNVTYCYNSYQYLSLDPASFSGFDAILGDAFLRNVYASFNYGELNTAGNGSFIQLMSTTDLNVALPDFRASRGYALATLPSELSPSDFLRYYTSDSSSYANSDSDSDSDSDSNIVGAIDTSSSPSSSSSSDSSDDKLYSLVKQYGPVVIGLLAGNILIGAVLCIIGVLTCMKTIVRSGARSKTLPSTYTPVRFKEAEAAEDNGFRYQD